MHGQQNIKISIIVAVKQHGAWRVSFNKASFMQLLPEEL
jgi:hypothetical protein